MAITLVGSEIAASDTLTLPAHQAGDLIVGFGIRYAVAFPTIPAGWSSLTRQDYAAAIGHGFAYKRATSSSETFGTWTSADLVGAFVVRASAGVPCIGHATSGASAAGGLDLRWDMQALFREESMMLLWATIGNLTTDIATAPSGFTNVQNGDDGTRELVMHFSDAAIGPGLPIASQVLTGSTSNRRLALAEIIEIEIEVSGGGPRNLFGNSLFGG